MVLRPCSRKSATIADRNSWLNISRVRPTRAINSFRGPGGPILGRALRCQPVHGEQWLFTSWKRDDFIKDTGYATFHGSEHDRKVRSEEHTSELQSLRHL